MLFGALKRKTSIVSPQYRVTKVRPLHIICHSDVFKINKMNYPIYALRERQTLSLMRPPLHVVALGPGCMSVSSPSGKQQMLGSNSSHFPESPCSTSAEENGPLLGSGSKLGGTVLFAYKIIFIQTASVDMCMPSDKKLVSRHVLFMFCLEFTLQCGLILQIDVCRAICARGESKQHLEGTV